MKTMRKLGITLLLLASGISAAACGDEDGVEKTWEEEIILQLFRPASLSPGTLTVSAASGTGQPVSLLVNADGKFFSDCESNKIRILPRKTSGAYQQVTVTVHSSVLQKVTKSVPVPVPAADNVVQMVLKNDKQLVPAACAPKVQLRKVGDSCAQDTDCEHNKCLKSVVDSSGTITFHDGYCSEVCTKTKTCTNTKHICKDFGGISQPNKPYYCLKNCTGNIDCRAGDGYSCTAGGACMP